MNTDDLEYNMDRSTFPEAVEAIRRVFEAIPDDYEERFIDLVEEEFEGLTWEAVKVRWKVLVFSVFFLFTYAVGSVWLVDGILNGREETQAKDLLPWFGGLAILVMGLSITAVWRFFRWIEKGNRGRMIPSLEMYRSGQEYYLLEAAGRAREILEQELEDEIQEREILISRVRPRS